MNKKKLIPISIFVVFLLLMTPNVSAVNSHLTKDPFQYNLKDISSMLQNKLITKEEFNPVIALVVAIISLVLALLIYFIIQPLLKLVIMILEVLVAIFTVVAAVAGFIHWLYYLLQDLIEAIEIIIDLIADLADLIPPPEGSIGIPTRERTFSELYKDIYNSILGIDEYKA